MSRMSKHFTVLSPRLGSPAHRRGMAGHPIALWPAFTMFGRTLRDMPLDHLEWQLRQCPSHHARRPPGHNGRQESLLVGGATRYVEMHPR